MDFDLGLQRVIVAASPDRGTPPGAASLLVRVLTSHRPNRVEFTLDSQDPKAAEQHPISYMFHDTGMVAYYQHVYQPLLSKPLLSMLSIIQEPIRV